MNAIAKIETFRVPPRWLFVRVETRDGITGWGEASLEGHAEAVEGAFASLSDRFIGTDAAKIEDIWQTAYRLGFYRGGPVLMSALSGLDQALWDIKGKSLGLPVWQLLGGAVRERVRAYAWIGGDTPGEVAEQAEHRRAQGFRAVKMNATGALGWLDSPKTLDGVVERVARVKALGLDVGVDFHGRIHKPMARQLAALLEPLRPMFIEEPLLSEQTEGLRQLAAQTSLPIALGERLYSRWDFKPFLEDAIIDMPSPTSPMPAASPNAAGSPPSPRPMTWRSRPTAPWGPWRLPPACSLRWPRPISSSRKCRWASITTAKSMTFSPIFRTRFPSG